MPPPDQIATPGSDLLAGNPGAGAPAAGGEQAPAAGTPAAETGAGDQGGNTGEAAPSPLKFDAYDVPEAHLKAIQAKGWKGVGDVLESYLSLEKTVSLTNNGEVDRVLVRPKPDAKPEEVADFFGKAMAPFVPKDAAGYGIKAPEGVDAAPFEEASGILLAAGTPKPIADKLMAALGASEKAKVDAFVTQSTKDVEALQGEWGAEFEAKAELGRRAAAAVGLGAEQLQRIEIAIGTKAMLTALAEFGKQYGEMPAPTPDDQGKGNNQFRMSVEQAKAKVDELNKDAEFQSRYLSPNPKVREKAIAEMEALMVIVAGAQPAG